MGSIEAAVRSVFGSRNAEAAAFQPLVKSWPIFHIGSLHGPERSGEELSSIIEDEIIPRLLVAHRSPAADGKMLQDLGERRQSFKANDASETLAKLALSRDAKSLERCLQQFVDRGLPSGAIYSEILGPAGRLLIELWSTDRISYSEATIALGRLQRLVRELPGETPYNGEDDPKCRSALFAPLPGGRQTFEFYIMEEQFRWCGWRTCLESPTSREAMSLAVSSHWYDLFCASLPRGAHVGEVAQAIAAIRRASRNPDLFILVADSPSAEKADLPDIVGADAAASNGDEAMEIMDHALRRHAA